MVSAGEGPGPRSAWAPVEPVQATELKGSRHAPAAMMIVFIEGSWSFARRTREWDPLTARKIVPVVPSRAAFVPYSLPDKATARIDRKSTRLNSSHVKISYAVFCLK